MNSIHPTPHDRCVDDLNPPSVTAALICLEVHRSRNRPTAASLRGDGRINRTGYMPVRSNCPRGEQVPPLIQPRVWDSYTSINLPTSVSIPTFVNTTIVFSTLGRVGSASVPTNSMKWRISHLKLRCSAAVTASKSADEPVMRPFVGTIVLDRLESARKLDSRTLHLDAFSKLKWQLVGTDGRFRHVYGGWRQVHPKCLARISP